MADGTEIEWTDATWNPVTGCSVVSPGCTHCYAMKLAGGRLMHTPSRQGLTDATKAGPVWNGQVRFNEEWLDQPLRWTRARKIFVCAHGDLFHENVPDAWIDRVFAVMALSPQHTFQVLTKRARRMREYFEGRRANFGRASDALQELSHCLSEAAHESACNRLDLFDSAGIAQRNIWLGVSAEDQQRADERVPDLLATPAAVRFVSAEPLLGPIDFGEAWHGESALDAECWGDCAWCSKGFPPLHNCRRVPGDPSKDRSGLDWIIVGGESGQRARPMHPDWARSIRDQCAAAGVPFFFKQWGVWAPGENATSLPTRTEHVATLWSDPGEPVKWKFGTITPRVSEEQHRDDAPDVYRLGKKATGHLLDGVEHHAFPHPEPAEGPEAR